MSLFPIPAKVEERLDKLRRDFLWLGNKEGKGRHLFKWQVVQLHKQSGGGGLGIRNPRIQNTCLLSKWLWRFTRETHALWRELQLKNKYPDSHSSKLNKRTPIIFVVRFMPPCRPFLQEQQPQSLEISIA
ncbi:hypothetical protein H5410_010109 [Solanum commersonii]|uniref:Uncharacterized protein n=1 Tax=Solanum commersonii TaxID=4109 RepID=A0A9J6AKQ4_SOLCO|nr:hypothetical protein H5410_010109 [Solanum commersonii]